MLRGIDRRPLVFVLGISSQVISAAAARWQAVWKKLMEFPLDSGDGDARLQALASGEHKKGEVP
jgi:hypothetical protein